jgi:ABC-type transport system involved in cytochrome c biogenesis permease subunit
MIPEIVIHVLNYLLAISYIVCTVLYGMHFFAKSSDPGNYSLTRFGLRFLIILQFLYFVARGVDYGHAPITTPFELMTLLAFGITLTYLYIEYKTGVTQTGFFILLIAAIFQIVSTIFITELPEINPVLKSWLLGVHVATALVGYSAIIISGIYGFLYLKMYTHIKSNKPSNFYKKLPSLHLLEKLAANSIKFGFLFLSVTMIIGGIWLPSAIENFSLADPKLISTFVVWITYLLGYISIKIYRTQSRTTMKLALLGFVLAVCSILVVNFVFQSFHRFY